ncbi:MAG: hypothetical protein ACLQVL_04750 [Terriglobia bacterium]
MARRCPRTAECLGLTHDQRRRHQAARKFVAARPDRLREYRARLKRIAEIARRHAAASNSGAKELAETAEWIVARWSESPNRNVLDDHLS